VVEVSIPLFHEVSWIFSMVKVMEVVLLKGTGKK
jgi:hypothetical protein